MENRHPFRDKDREPLPEGLRFEVDDRDATFSVTMRDDRAQLVHSALGEDDTPVGAVFPDAGNPYLYPSFAAAAGAANFPVLPSLEMLLHPSKQADDRLMAAIERDRSPDRDAWVADALAAVDPAADPEAATWLAAAAVLAGLDAPEATRAQAEAQVEAFLADPRKSYPVGIYSGDEALARIFRRDRWLSQELEGNEPDHVAVARGLRALLARDADLRARHDAALALQARLTNPPANASLVDVAPDALPPLFHFVAPARSPETELVKKRGGTRNIPEGPMQALVDAVRSGEVDLRPAEDAGWYAHQLWALEPLLRFAHPEKLHFDDGYVDRLEKAFKAAFAMRRETQIKSVELPAIGAAAPPPVVVHVAPDFRVEPLPTHFDRSADSYAFLEEQVLDPQLGARWRDWEDGALASELGQVAARYRAVAALSRADLGLAYADEADPAAVEAAAWLAGWSEDPALAEDVRFLIPFGQNPEGEQLAWAVLGVKVVDIEVAYGEPPQVVLSDPSLVAEVRTHTRSYSLLVPVFQEVEVGAILAREPFRELADAHPFQKDLVRALKGASQPP